MKPITYSIIFDLDGTLVHSVPDMHYAINKTLKEYNLKIISEENFNDLSITFLKVISNNKRFANLSSITKQFMNINEQKRGIILADITSADELLDDQRKNINDQLRTILGDKLSLNFKVDKKIIGGLIIKVGSKMIDTSLINKINKLKIAMKGA